MPEVHTCFEQFLHGNRGHEASLYVASRLTFVLPGLNPQKRRMVSREQLPQDSQP
jgi:hypothetical protein